MHALQVNNFFPETTHFMQIYHANSWKNILFASVYIFEYLPVYTKDYKMLDYIVTLERVVAQVIRAVLEHTFVTP